MVHATEAVKIRELNYHLCVKRLDIIAYLTLPAVVHKALKPHVALSASRQSGISNREDINSNQKRVFRYPPPPLIGILSLE